MIRIQLVHEGRVVKTISSRVHEAIVLEQVKRFANPVDEIRIVEGELSEAGKGILHHVAKKIVPAAMAAGMAMAAHGQNVGTPGQNRDFPGLDRSIGQHISDIFSPNYQERMRQRNYEMQTQQAEWTARQNELRQARIQAAREAGRAEAGSSNVKVYDQARTSNDGKHFVIYGMDNTITRIPTQGTEFMPADSQRLAHYIAPNGQVYYVRHAAGTMTESVVREFAPNDGGNGGDDYLRTLASAWYNQDLSAIADQVKKDKNPKKKRMMDRVIDETTPLMPITFYKGLDQVFKDPDKRKPIKISDDDLRKPEQGRGDADDPRARILIPEEYNFEVMINNIDELFSSEIRRLTNRDIPKYARISLEEQKEQIEANEEEKERKNHAKIERANKKSDSSKLNKKSPKKKEDPS
jgi:hypothetical protein